LNNLAWLWTIMNTISWRAYIRLNIVFTDWGYFTPIGFGVFLFGNLVRKEISKLKQYICKNNAYMPWKNFVISSLVKWCWFKVLNSYWFQILYRASSDITFCNSFFLSCQQSINKLFFLLFIKQNVQTWNNNSNGVTMITCQWTVIHLG
jgi:hypothetical protein